METWLDVRVREVSLCLSTRQRMEFSDQLDAPATLPLVHVR
jgi:hypothetical protein